MRTTQLLFYTIIFFVFCLPVHAQTNHYESDHSKGYNGDYLKNISVSDSSLNFIAIGDWGRCGEFYQKEVAQQMAKASVSVDASFIVSTGDNFYPSGVASVNDPLWDRSFENVYYQFSLQKEWDVILGNHDYKTNPQAEVEYTQKSGH